MPSLSSPAVRTTGRLSARRARTPVGVLGASGYVGRELCALIARHPALQLVFATANEQRGASPHVGGDAPRWIAAEDAPLGEAALVFSALPHGTSARWVRRTRAAGARVVDLSSDLRPGSAEGGEAPYGLPELARAALPDATVVANPGCYPTAVLAALYPLVVASLIAPDGTISVSAASGVTGAGRAPRPELLFAEVTENVRPYAVGNDHRHVLEMTSVLSPLGCRSDLVFTPHLLPVARGILATITVPLCRPLVGDPLAPWRECYDGEPFIEVVAEAPTLRDVVHRNVVRITARLASGVRHPTLIVVAAIDNLVKGAAGQAIQNANLMLGLDETVGLPA